MRKYGIFWLPTGELRETINAWKQRLRTIEPNAAYVNHPVHMTLFLFMASEKNEQKLADELMRLCVTHYPFRLRLAGWHVFPTDAAAGGGDTLMVCFQESRDLRLLQQSVAVVFGNLRGGDVSYSVTWAGPFFESLQTWGFPFVGDHWIPHVSVGVAREAGGKTIVAQALRLGISDTWHDLSKLSLVRIEDEEHITLHEGALRTC